MAIQPSLNPAFRHGSYLIRRKVLKLFGGAFHIYDGAGNLLLFSEQKAFKLREDFRVYADESKAQELLTIKTPQIIDFAATYWVEDPLSAEVVGAVKRQGIKSIVRDEWLLLSQAGEEIGRLNEASLGGAILSRLISLIPQRYQVVTTEGAPVAQLEQHFDPFVLKYSMTIAALDPAIDRRLLLAAGILLAAIERRQE